MRSRNLDRSVAGRSALVFLAAIGVVAGRPACGLGPVPAGAQRFLAANCLACHDDAQATANLSVESLTDDFGDPRWARIHDRLAAGEMPPADETQPEPAAKTKFLRALGQRVTAAVAARHAAEGRVVLRRMNRREYEHALHDLLGIATPLAGILPEDPLVHGFDTTASGCSATCPAGPGCPRAGSRRRTGPVGPPAASSASIRSRWSRPTPRPTPNG
jgi:mono/diheme cytochrome c family protein